MSTHTMTTDAEGRATFRCTEPADAACHVWADCLSEDGCESNDGDCTHTPVQHDNCIYSVWWSTPEDAESMHVDENGDSEVTPKPNMIDAPIEIEWDECPLWSFAGGEAA
ncbi:hypothetical protein CQ047_11990 [Microbacterium sp. MYb72]|uniref:hypothetical protein n=1 Tax=Microbacterium sp. MYb72 TaxID=1848693 RepID=UPI000CFD9167|nr:hypothetical protein [Microbacterium sp. MYb72]PRB08595.1 hypothetical protein CQ047_11990 [Microbacterium sp. MYb72]